PSARSDCTGGVSANVALPAVAGPLHRWRPHLRLPSCAGEPYPSPFMSANRRMTELREPGAAPKRTEHGTGAPNSSTHSRALATSSHFIEGGIKAQLTERPFSAPPSR